MLREALMEFDMFLPATFGKCAEEENDQWTWTSTVGTTHRLDYVALSDNFRNNDVRAFVETSIDLATMRPDHRLVACDITLGQEEGANGMIGGNVDMIETRCNLSRRVRGLDPCCSMLPVLIELLTLIHIWQCRMLTSYTLLSNVLRNNARRRKSLDF